jgi:hypothetical protein
MALLQGAPILGAMRALVAAVPAVLRHTGLTRQERAEVEAQVFAHAAVLLHAYLATLETHDPLAQPLDAVIVVCCALGVKLAVDDSVVSFVDLAELRDPQELPGPQELRNLQPRGAQELCSPQELCSLERTILAALDYRLLAHCVHSH